MAKTTTLALPKNALEHRVILLSGQEDALRMRALRELLAEAAGDDDFDLQTFVAGDSKPGDWLGSAMTAPFLADRRTAVVRNCLRESDPEEAIKASGIKIEELPATALVILVADDESGDDDKQRKFESARKAWEAMVKKEKGLVADFAIDLLGVKAAIREELAEQEKEMSPKAVDTLVEMTGGSLGRALDELEKLVLFAGDDPKIRDADVQEVVLPSREWSIWKLVDAVVAGNVSQALAELKTLVGNTNKPENTAFQQIMPMLSRQFRLLWQARICVEAKVAPAAAPEAIKAQFSEKTSILSGADWTRDKAMRAARQMPFDQLERCFVALSDADARLKGIEAGFSTIDTLERMVLEMVEAVRAGRKPARA